MSEQQPHHHETAEEFVEEAEVAAWQTVEEVKDLPGEVADYVRSALPGHHHHKHEAEAPEQPETPTA
jgi:hypothetical protein